MPWYGGSWVSNVLVVDLTSTGVVFVANGTAAAPSQTYTSDTDLGSYRIGANNEGYTAGGVLRWDYNTTRLALSASYQLTAGANTLIGTTADKLNAVHLAIASQAIGDILYADAATTFARLADVATGQVLTSGGVGVAPAWSAAPTIGTSLTLGGATPTALTNIRVYSQTITPASVAAAVAAEQTFTVTGLTTADKVFINPAATGNATSACQARVSAADTLAIMYVNPTAGALTPGSGTMLILAIRS